MLKTTFGVIVLTVSIGWLVYITGVVAIIMFRRTFSRRPLPPLSPVSKPPKPEEAEPKEPKLRKLYDIYTVPPSKVIPSDEELGIVRPQLGMYIAKPCAHREEPRAFSYEVFGVNVRVPHVTRCPDCMQTLLEHFFERCAACGLGIPGGCKVGISWIGAPHPYTHLDCAESTLLFCGIWEHGRLLTLNQISDEFNPNVATVMQDSEIDTAREAEPRKPEAEAESEDTEETNPSGTPKPGVN